MLSSNKQIIDQISLARKQIIIPEVRCTKCNEVKPATPNYFHRDKQKLARICKDCVKLRVSTAIPKQETTFVKTFRREHNLNTAFLQVYNGYRASARQRNIKWNLELEDFLALITSPCFYTGRTASNTSKVPGKDGDEIFKYNGIDRIDSTQGYVKENCVTCCADVNRAKRSLSLHDFLTLCLDIVEHVGKDESKLLLC